MRALSAILVGGCVLAAGCADHRTDVVGPERTEDRALSRGEDRIGAVLLPISASAINNAGTIVGSVAGPGGRQAAVLDWSGQLTLLPGLGGANSTAADINGRGEIAGSAETADGSLRAVLWRDGVIHDLGTLGGENSWATGINASGQISGTSERASGLASAFLWTEGQIIELGHLPHGTFSWGNGLNDRGEVVGWSSGGGILQDPTLWADGEIYDLGTLAFEGAASQINNKGQIVGGSIPLRQTWGAATFWDRGEIIDLGYLIHPCEPKFSIACTHFSSASAINQRGQIVGTHDFLGSYLWHSGNLVILPELTPSLFSGPVDINDAGSVVGRGGELWGTIPPALARMNMVSTSAFAVERLSAPLGPRPWSAAYCTARGQMGGLVSDLDWLAGCLGTGS